MYRSKDPMECQMYVERNEKPPQNVIDKGAYMGLSLKDAQLHQFFARMATLR